MSYKRCSRNGNSAVEVLGQGRDRNASDPTAYFRASDSWLAQDPARRARTLAPVEITSALWRLVRSGEVAEEVAHVADVRSQELMAASYTVADVETVKGIAQRLLRVHALRAADALQLGAALLWASNRPEGKALLTFDDRLALATRREGFEVLA